MKILFSDVDGTLIEKGQAISTKNLDKMKEMQEKGHKIALCTGRNHIDIQPVLNNIEIPYDYLVLCNGSYISDATGKVLFEEHLSKELGTKIIHHLLKDPNIVVAFCYDQGCPVYAKGQTKILGLNGLEDCEDDFLDLLETVDKFYMLSIHYKDLNVDMIKKVAQELTTLYPEIETHLNQQYVDIAPLGHSKGTGLQTLLKIIGPVEKSFAIGDSYNDLPMINAADCGATFPYALQDIQDQADEVVSYVYEFIDDQIL